jgi:hypothetical protein
MKTSPVTIALTAANLGLLLFVLLSRTPPAHAEDGLPVLRGRALEILDDEGRVRASILLHAAEKGYPETVMLRLIDEHGRPEVKMGASERGGGVSFLGVDDGTQVLLRADGEECSLKLANADGKQQILKP